VHACIGVGSLKPLKDLLSSDGISSCAKEMTGIVGGVSSGVWIVIECFSRNCLASAGVAGEAPGVGETPFEVDGVASVVEGVVVSPSAAEASFLRFFFSFFDSDAAANFSTAFSSSASRFLFFFFLSSIETIEQSFSYPGHRSKCN